MKIFLLILFLLTLENTVFAQVDNSIWDSLKTYSTDNYKLQVPYKWRSLQADPRTEQFFEASGLAFQPFLDGSPVIVTVFIYKQPGSDLKDCKTKILNGYRENPGREFPENFKDGQKKIKLQSGQNAYIFNTRFYRKEKDLNQSRFDLVTYSDKAETGFTYGLSIQYADSEYIFETDNYLAEFAKKLFSYFELK